jgi:hypothetical protein
MDRVIDNTSANRLDAFLDNQEAGLQEVNATEMNQVDGGFPVLVIVALIGLATAIVKKL